jgi:RimJ/RimL family protein N-acetyltransferase
MIKTKRFILRDYDEKDLNEHVAILGNPEVAQWLSSNIPMPYPKSAGRQFIAGAINDNKTKITNFTLAIEDKATGKHVGGIKVFGLKKETEIGYWVAEEFWGQGIGTEVLTAMIKYVFTKGGVEELVAQTSTANEGSKAILKKGGFSHGGETPEEYARCGNKEGDCSSFFRLSLKTWQKLNTK